MKETPVRWIPFIAIFLYVYIEISIFIQVAHVLGVLLTLILVIFSSVVGMSLVRNQGFKNFMLMQQKMAAGESPAAEMIKSVSLIIAGLLLLLPGFFTDFLGLLLLLPPVQKHLTLKLMPHLRFSRMPGGGLAPEPEAVRPLTGSISAKMKSATVWIIKTTAKPAGRADAALIMMSRIALRCPAFYGMF
jgi:UPF0716 protein FxsA